MRLLYGAVFFLSLIFVAAAGGEFYSYTDGKGDVHFVDDVNKVPKKYRKQLKDAEPRGSVNIMDARSHAARGRSEPQRKSGDAANGAKVEVYMTSWCGYCKKMIRFLNEKGISYAAYDIEKDRAAAGTYHELGGRGVPLVRVGSHIIRGYDPDAVMSYYNGGN